MSDPNPYASPQFSSETLFGPSATPADAVSSPGVVRALAETRPWVRFLSILGFVVTGLIAVAVIAMVGAALFGGEVMVGVVAVFYLLGALLYGAGSYYLFAYSQRIGDFLRNPQRPQLEAALVAQKSFWKLLGIVAAVYLVCVVLMIPLMVAVTVLG